MTTSSGTTRGAIKRHVATAFGVLLLIGALYVVQREFRNLAWRDIREALHATPSLTLIFAAGWTVATYAVLSAYDRLVHLCRPSGVLGPQCLCLLLRLCAGQ